MRGAFFLLTRGQYAPIIGGMNLHAEAIRAAGGRTYLAGALRLPVETVKSWPRRGIPAKYWHHVVSLAVGKMPELTIEALEHARPAADDEAEAA